MSEAYDLKKYPAPIREFTTYKLGIQGCSKKTVEEYLLDLRMFTRFMYSYKNSLPVKDEDFEKLDISGIDFDFYDSLSPLDIYQYLHYLNDVRNDGVASRSRKLSAVRSFYKCMTLKLRRFENNPTVGIENPKKKPSLPKHLTFDESVSLLETVKEDVSNPHRERDYAILVLFLNCGMRLSELAGISLTDIDNEMRSLRVIGKGSKERIVYLNDACRQALAAYLPKRGAMLRDGSWNNALFLSRIGNRISIKTVQYLVKKHLEEAGLGNRDFSTHKLRHTAATLMYQTGEVDIRVLKEILGHEQLNTTQIYTHVSNEGMEQAINKNPLAELNGIDTEKAE